MIRVAAACLLLASCASTPPEPVIRTVEVKVPVPVTCVPANATTDPVFRVTRADILAASSAAERLRLLGVGFLERDAWMGETVPVLRGCK